MTAKEMYSVGDYRIMAECGQDFEPLMPAVIEKIGEVGAAKEGAVELSVFDQGLGVSPEATADVAGLLEEAKEEDSNEQPVEDKEETPAEGEEEKPAEGEEEENA